MRGRTSMRVKTVDKGKRQLKRAENNTKQEKMSFVEITVIVSLDWKI